MVEIRIHGRGGQGGVTLAKLVATSRFLRGFSVQAFGLYAAERSGAPVQAFCRYAREAIATRNLVYDPDHVVVLDPTLAEPEVAVGLDARGWILVNAAGGVDRLRELFPGRRLATVDATSLARERGLGTRAVPIVNTALAGAVARLLGFPLEEMLAAVRHLGFTAVDEDAARAAHAALRTFGSSGRPNARANGRTRVGPLAGTGPSFVRGAGGEAPRIRTGAWATERPVRRQHVPPCNDVCPAGNDVRGFLEALASGRVHEALGILLDTTPFPGVCGRVCPAPCRASCNRIALEGAVDVPRLERWAADHGSVELLAAAPRAERVAVVGGGPAGLAAAYHLARLGYGVTVYEAGSRVGGLLRTGIPDFRLPPAVVEREVGRILDYGVEVVTGVRVDGARLLELARAHDAVVVATGLQTVRSVRMEGDGADAAEDALDFLARAKGGEARAAGDDVVVVGGGNTAADAARSALRLGARSARIVYRRTRAEMPAIPAEVDEALEEGVALDVLLQPVVLRRAGQADGDEGTLHLACRRMELGAPDATGRRRPVEVPGSEVVLTCHRVLLALGHEADRTLLPADVEADPLEAHAIARGAAFRDGEARPAGRSTVAGDLGRDPTDRPADLAGRIVLAGDFATGEGTVAAAIGSGRRAALDLHRALSGEEAEGGERARAREDADEWTGRAIRSDALGLRLFERREPAVARTPPIERRRATFDEVDAGLTDASEALRCLSCGVCNECDRCVTYCPDGVLRRVGHRLVVDAFQCKGCGVCAVECPRGVVAMTGRPHAT